MEVLLAIVISVLFACALRKQIKRYAVSFYIVAVAVDVLFLSGVLFGVLVTTAAAWARAVAAFTWISRIRSSDWASRSPGSACAARRHRASKPR